MTVKAVVFDMDGVLINSEPLWREITLQIMLDAGMPTNMQEISSMTGKPAYDIVEFFYNKYGQRKETIPQLADRLNKTAIDYILEAKPMFPNVPTVLEHLASLDIKIGIASASPISLLENITLRCNIRKYFSQITSAVDLSHNKPHPLVYLHTIHALDAAPYAAVGIEDSITGMTAVKAANMRCIVIPEEQCMTDPRWSMAEYQIDDIIKVTDIITK